MKNSLIVLLTLCCYSAFSQVQLTDLVVPGAPPPSYAQQYFEFNNELFFLADDSRTGSEIWKTDGTSAGTKILKDINVGFGGSAPSNFVIFNNKLYFLADDGISGKQFWSSDGTAEGTTRVTNDLYIPNGFNNLHKITVLGNFIYYLVKPSDYVLEVWKFDGTNATLVKGNISAWNGPANLTTAIGLVFFSAQPYESNNSRVWRTDGTDAGTFPVTEEINGPGIVNGTTHPSHFIEYNGALYLIARSTSFPGASVAIMKSDGTAAGTNHVVGVHDGNTDLVNYGEAIVHNGKMYFSFHPSTGRRFFVCESDGTAGSTSRIFNHVSSAYFSPSSMASVGNDLYFTAGNANGNTWLTKLNTETLESTPVKDMGNVPAPFFFFKDINVSNVKNLGGKIFVRLQKSIALGTETWSSDGTEASTLKISSSTLYSALIVPELVSYKSQAFFTGSDGEPWKSDGTAAGTVLLKDVNTSPMGLDVFTPMVSPTDDIALFGSNTESQGYELWSTDATKEGSAMLTDIFAGLSSSSPRNLIAHQGKVYFTAISQNNKTEVFSYDATTEATLPLTNFLSLNFRAQYLYRLNETKFMVAAYKSDNTYSLFTMNLDGSVTELKYFGKNANNFPFFVTETVILNGVMYFLLTGEGTQLWKSDGTVEGTVKVAQFAEAGQLTATSNRVYAVAKEEYLGPNHIVVSDGTENGTDFLVELGARAYASTQNLFGFGDKLIYCNYATESGVEPWIIDAAGNASLLKDIFTGKGNGVGNPQFTLFNGKVFFAASNTTAGSELWRTDGTTAGTILVKDINPGIGSSKPVNFSVLNSMLYFSAYSPQTGYEVWKLESESDEPMFVTDVVPGEKSSNPSKFRMINNTLVFFAESLTDGDQLFAYAETVTSITEDEITGIVYPNPTSGVITVKSERVRGSRLVTYDGSGRAILAAFANSDEIHLNLANYPSGVYLLRFSRGNSSWTTKVIKI